MSFLMYPILIVLGLGCSWIIFCVLLTLVVGLVGGLYNGEFDMALFCGSILAVIAYVSIHLI